MRLHGEGVCCTLETGQFNSPQNIKPPPRGQQIDCYAGLTGCEGVNRFYNFSVYAQS